MTPRVRVCVTVSLLIFGLMNGVPRPAFARTFVVNKKSDHAPGACNATDCTLREAILAANDRDGHDTIRLAKGTYSLTIQGDPDDDAGLVGDLDITERLTIDGVSSKETIVEGAWGSRLNSIFHVLNGKTSIINTAVRKGFRGITVSSSGGLVLLHSALRNNGTETTPGGGLFTEGTATVANTEVTGNKADLGGGIYTSAVIEMRNSLVENNKAVRGGGISSGGRTEIADSIVRDNTATNGGGGGISSYGFLVLSGSTVEQNDAVEGGGIYSYQKYEISGSKIIGNSAQTDGGGLFDSSGKPSNIRRTLIKGNKAKGNGGGIYKVKSPIDDCNDLFLRAVTLVNNRADSDRDGGGGGGGAYSSCEKETVSFLHSLIKGNTGFNGGGMFMSARFVVSYSTVANNEAWGGHGGGVFATGGLTTPEVEYSALVDNKAGLGGGAIASQGVTPLGVSYSTVSGNKAKTYGGGFDVFSGGEIYLRRVTVTNNRADSDGTGGGGGGGLQNSGADLFIVDQSIVAGNSVGSSGTSPNCAGTFSSERFNLIGNATGCGGFTQQHDKIGIDPRLLPLARNGGPTRTHALRPSSQAVNFGPFCNEEDQRGAGAQQRCDAGAYERVECEDVLVSHVGTAGQDRLVGTNRADGFLGNDGADIIRGLGGDDGLCGQGGNDRLEGGPGKDILNGGGQSDNCFGGPGPDFFINCEDEVEN